MSNYTTSFFGGISSGGDDDDGDSSGPSVMDEKLRNISGILQNRFPEIDFVDIPSTSANFLLFMCSLVFGIFWITYITFFNSRVVGKILTKIANSFLNTGGHIKVDIFDKVI